MPPCSYISITKLSMGMHSFSLREITASKKITVVNKNLIIINPCTNKILQTLTNFSVSLLILLRVYSTQELTQLKHCQALRKLQIGLSKFLTNNLHLENFSLTFD